MPIIPSFRWPAAGVMLAGAVLLLAPGCARTRVENSLATKVAAGDVNAELDFWDALSERPLVSNDEGFHGLILFTDRADPAGTYAERLAIARQRGWVGKKWNEPGDLAMQRGTLARAVAVACGIKGGVMMQAVGPAPRYANRELQYLGVMGAGSGQQAVSGREFMGVLSKAQDYLQQEEEMQPGQASGAATKPSAAPPEAGPPLVPRGKRSGSGPIE